MRGLEPNVGIIIPELGINHGASAAGAAEDRAASSRARTSAATSSTLMLFRHRLSLQGDRRWLCGPMHGLQEYPVWIASRLLVSGR